MGGRGVRWTSSNEAGREDSVGRRSAVRPERRTLRTTRRSARARRGRRRDQGTTCTRFGARSPSSCRLVRATAGCDGGAATKLSVRMASVGARRCGRDGARGARRLDRRTSTRSTAARSKNDVLAARRALAVVVAAHVSRRRRWKSSNEPDRLHEVVARAAAAVATTSVPTHDGRAAAMWPVRIPGSDSWEWATAEGLIGGGAGCGRSSSEPDADSAVMGWHVGRVLCGANPFMGTSSAATSHVFHSSAVHRRVRPLHALRKGNAPARGLSPSVQGRSVTCKLRTPLCAAGFWVARAGARLRSLSLRGEAQHARLRRARDVLRGLWSFRALWRGTAPA